MEAVPGRSNSFRRHSYTDGSLALCEVIFPAFMCLGNGLMSAFVSLSSH